jgi:ribonuclease HII
MPTIKYTQKFTKNRFEQETWAKNRVICGVDEVGRGCLAGPVMVGAVILHPGKNSRLLKDSKIMTASEREKAYNWIIKNSWSSVALVDHRIIDRCNIYQATLISMRRAFMQLMAQRPLTPECVLVDAMPLSLEKSAFEEINVYHFPFGESRSSSIAAASIVAKVTRDRLMQKLDPVFCHYNFTSNKGYATPIHKKMVKEHGHSIIHRLNFLKGWKLLPKDSDETNNQQTIL